MRRERVLSWVLWSVGALFVGMTVVFVAMDWDVVSSGEPSDRRVEIFDSLVVGYDGGKRSWEVSSQYIWAGRSRYLFRIEDVKEGRLYNSRDEVVLDGLTAAHVRVNSKSKTLTAHGGVSATIIDQGDHDVAASESPISLRSDELKYFDISNTAYLKGAVEIVQSDTEIYPKGQVVFDTDRNVADLDGGVSMRSKLLRLESDLMSILIDDRQSEFKKNVRGERLPEVESDTSYDDREARVRGMTTQFSADYMMYAHDDDDHLSVELRGHVDVSQSDKHIMADEARYDAARKRFDLVGNVQFVTSELMWLLDDEKKSSFDNPNMAKTAESAVTVNCDVLVFDAGQKEIRADGDVRIVQSDKTVRCRGFVYEDATGTLVLNGPVTVDRDNGEELQSKAMVIRVYDEVIDADGQVSAEFLIKD